MNWIYIHWGNVVFLCTILGCFLLHLIHGSGSPAPAYPSEVANLLAVCASFSICWALLQEMAIATVFTCLLCGCFCMCVSSQAFLVYVFVTFSLSNSFISVRLCMMVEWALCTLTLLSQDNTFLLVISLLPHTFVSSLIISPNISVLF